MKDRIIYFIVKTFWPNKLLVKKRENILKSLFKISTYDRYKSISEKTEVEPWAFIRVCNEIKTLSASLNSITPLFKRGVIGYNSCTDGSEEIILNFCKRHPNFIPLKYEYEVYPCSFGKRISTVPYENTLAAYYNAVLDIIPKNEWFMKIEVDHFYFQKIMKNSFTLPKTPRDAVIYSRLDLVRKGDDIRVIKYRRPGDQWLIFNKDLKFKNTISQDGKIYCEELIMPTKTAKFKPECSNFHFPYEKESRNFDDDLFYKLEKFEDFMDTADPNEFSDEVKSIETLHQIIGEFDKQKK